MLLNCCRLASLLATTVSKPVAAKFSFAKETLASAFSQRRPADRGTLSTETFPQRSACKILRRSSACWAAACFRNAQHLMGQMSEDARKSGTGQERRLHFHGLLFQALQGVDVQKIVQNKGSATVCHGYRHRDDLSIEACQKFLTTTLSAHVSSDTIQCLSEQCACEGLPWMEPLAAPWG